MITKFIILFAMIIILGALFSSLLFLLRDSGNNQRSLKALTIRISLSLILFIFLIIAFKLGFITPHGI